MRLCIILLLAMSLSSMKCVAIHGREKEAKKEIQILYSEVKESEHFRSRAGTILVHRGNGYYNETLTLARCEISALDGTVIISNTAQLRASNGFGGSQYERTILWLTDTEGAKFVSYFNQVKQDPYNSYVYIDLENERVEFMSLEVSDGKDD